MAHDPRSWRVGGLTPYSRSGSGSNMHKAERGNYIIMGGNTGNANLTVNVNPMVGRWGPNENEARSLSGGS